MRGDATQLHQVVIILCTNACSAMATSKGVLELRAATVRGSDAPDGRRPEKGEGRCVRLTVRDSGVGLDGATAARIFDPFFTAGPAEERTEFGLSVVHDIVSRHLEFGPHRRSFTVWHDVHTRRNADFWPNNSGA